MTVAQIALRARATAALALVCLLALLCDGALAGSFEVNPIRVDLSGANRSVALTVKNAGTDPVVTQVSVLAWAQENGRDVLTPTKDVLVSPPIATIAPGAEQILRVGLRRAPDAVSELSYRLFVQEVPPPPKPGFQGLVVALRVSLPIFVQPHPGPAKATLVWDAELRADGNIRLKMANQGTGHIQVAGIDLFVAGDAEALAGQSGLTYVLPGQAREWDLKPRHSRIKKGDRVRLKVSTDAGSIDTELDLSGQ